MEYGDEEIFDDFEESFAGSIVEEHLDSILYASNDSVAQHVDSFAEVITEYYLFDSSCEKNIQKFLKSEGLSDILTESEFMDLICGEAYLQDDIVQFIALKLPFLITLERLRVLNNMTKKKNPFAYLITKDGIGDRIKETLQEKQQNKNEKERERKRKYRLEHPECDRLYYLANREKLLRTKKEYYIAHREEILERKRKKYHENPKYYKAYLAEMYRKHKSKRQQYARDHKEQINANNKKSYQRHKTEHNARTKKYYEEHKEDILDWQRRYNAEHSEEIKQRRQKYYMDNKEESIAKSNDARRQRRQREKSARSVCAVWLFLKKLKRKNEAEYLKLYTKYQDPVTNFVQTCAALQSMDLKKCPFFDDDITNETVQQYCPGSKVFSVPGASDEIQKYIEQLKQNAR